MVEINIPREKVKVVEEWCKKNIGPRQFWIHNQRGGNGWVIESDKRLRIYDDKKAVFLILGCL